MRRLASALGIVLLLASGCSAADDTAAPTGSTTSAAPSPGDPDAEHDSGPGVVQPPADDEQVSPRTGAVALGPKAPCDETYAAAALTAREFAFDGTVTAIEGDVVTFEPHEWFVGDRDLPATVTVGLAPATTSGLSEAGPPYGIGSRLLVSGDGTRAWGCGFTRYFDADTAAAWRAVS